MSSTKRYHSTDKRQEQRHRDDERIGGRHSSRYDDGKKKDSKGEDLRLKIKRIKQEQGDIPKHDKPIVQLDHLRTDNENDCKEISSGANLLRRSTNLMPGISVAEKSPVKITEEETSTVLNKDDKTEENTEIYKSRLAIQNKSTEIIYSEASDSEDTSSNGEEYEALACLIKQYSKKKHKKKKRKIDSSDEDSSVQMKNKKKKIYVSSDEESSEEETKKNKKRHLKNVKESQKRKKKKKCDVESESQDEEIESEKERKSKKSKKKKKKKKSKKKKKQISSDSSSSDEDTAALEEELIKIRKIKEMKMKLLLDKENEESNKKVKNRFDQPKYYKQETKSPPSIQNKKRITVTSESEPYFDSEAETALQRAKQELKEKNEGKNDERKNNRIDPLIQIKEELSNRENDREKKCDKHIRHVRYCKDDGKNLIRKRSPAMDKTTAIKNKIMNNMRNKTSENKKQSSMYEEPEVLKSKYEKDPLKENRGTSSESFHRRSSSRSTQEQQPTCSTSYSKKSDKLIIEKTRKSSYHDDSEARAYKKDHKYRNGPTDENQRTFSESSQRRISSSRSINEQQPSCSTSYSEKLDKFINEKTRLIYHSKSQREKLICCNFCGISTHTIEDCKENESNGKNPLDIHGRKIECSQCGSFNHFVDVCMHTEAKGTNPFGFDGKKFRCGHCGSFDHKTNKCGKIHCEKLGKNPIGISGRKIACDNCNSFDHFGHDCTGLATGNINKKHEASCDHCGSFSHGSENCKEKTRVIRYKSDENVIASYFPLPTSKTQRKELPSSEESSDWFCQLPVEASLGQCRWCNSDIHCSKTCPVKHEREFGKNNKNEYGVMLDCAQCGSFNHLVDICFHSVVNGKNPVDHSGKKLACIFCGSHNHTYPCKDKDLEKHGKNQMEENGRKCRCDYCGSFDHLEKSCYHTKRFGKNLNLPNGTKKRCPYCGSYDHEIERACMQLNDQTREFLRMKMGFAKKKPSSEHSLNVNRFSNIIMKDVSWQAKKCPIIVDLDGETTPKQRQSRWNNYKGVSASENSFNGCELSQEEKVEQIDAERKMKERLMAKFKMIDPNFFGSENASKKGTSNEMSPISQEMESTEENVEIFEEEIMDEMVYDEPDESIFNDIELRAKTDRFPRITTNMHNDIVDAIKSEDDKITSAHNINITKHDLYGLTGQNWLNDKVIEFYLQMVAARSQSSEYRELNMPRIHCMSTYFFLNLIMRGYDALERWTKDVDIFSYDILLVPIHMDMHWCIAIIDFRSPGVFYYDSMGGHNMPALSAILTYLKEEHMNKKGTELDLRHFAKEIVSDCPQQQNGSDCGIFACKVAEYLSRETPLSFDQEDMSYYRKRMIWEIIKNQLLSP